MGKNKRTCNHSHRCGRCLRYAGADGTLGRGRPPGLRRHGFSEGAAERGRQNLFHLLHHPQGQRLGAAESRRNPADVSMYSVLYRRGHLPGDSPDEGALSGYADSEHPATISGAGGKLSTVRPERWYPPITGAAARVVESSPSRPLPSMSIRSASLPISCGIRFICTTQ